MADLLAAEGGVGAGNVAIALHYGRFACFKTSAEHFVRHALQLAYQRAKKQNAEGGIFQPEFKLNFVINTNRPRHRIPKCAAKATTGRRLLSNLLECCLRNIAYTPHMVTANKKAGLASFGTPRTFAN